MGTLLDASRSISGWHERRKTALSPIHRCLGVESQGIVQNEDWNVVPLALYLDGPPLSYYLEPAFTEYFEFLNHRFGTDLAVFAADLTNCGQDVWKGLALAENLAHEIHSTDVTQSDDYKKISNHLNPWYLRLVEQAFDSLLALPAYRLQQDVGKNVSQTPRGIHDVMKKHGWLTFGSYYDPTMRNGIGHDVEFVQDSHTSDLAVRYTDARGNRLELSLAEIVENVEGFLDECLGYCFALRLFVFEHRCDPELAAVVQPTTENFTGRELYSRQIAGSPFVAVNNVNRERVNGQVQIRIECTDTTTHDHERFVEVLSILATAADWFPEGETFFVGLTGDRRWPACLRISGDDLRGWLAGDIADEAFPKCFDPFMLWPLKKWLGHSRAKWKRAFSVFMTHMRKDLPKRDHTNGRFSCVHGYGFVDDTSTAIARRYGAEVFVTDTEQAQLKARLASLVAAIRSMRVFASPQAEKRWGGTKPHFIAAFIFSREKRSRDRWANPDSRFYVGNFEWRDPTIDSGKLPLAMSGDNVESLLDGSVRYVPNPNWPPRDLFIPRS